VLSIAATLRQARSNADLSQVDLAARAGTSQSALARYETGASLPTLPTLERLLAACGRRLEIQTPPAKPSAPVTSMRSQLGPQATELRRQRRRLLDAADKHGVSHLRAFGSVARGEAKASSDIDLLVRFAADADWSLLDHARMELELERLLRRRVDLVSRSAIENSPNWIRRNEILGTARLLYAA